MTSVAEKKAETEADPAPLRKLPVVLPRCVQRNRAGSVWSEWDVRFPEGGIADDLKEPGIWKRIQDNQNTAFKRFDEVRVLAFDASWIAHCIVAHASQTEVVLAVMRVTKMPERREHLYADELYEIQFDGVGYVVKRKSDGQAMTNSLVNPVLAEKALMQLYPQRVS